MDKISGVYRIVCVRNGDYYYGSTNNIRKRWYYHKYDLKNGKHCNARLQNNWNKYGESAFRFEIVEFIDENNLVETENRYLNEYVGKPHCMNISKIADRPPMTPATVEKIRKSNTGRRLSEETKNKIRKSLLGHSVSDVTRKKISEGQFGKLRGVRSDTDKMTISKKRRPQGFPRIKGPNGDIYIISTLTQFCKEHNLHLPSISALINKKILHYKNWSVIE